MSDKLCYSNNGFTMRYVDPEYVPVAGEVLFDDMPTTEQLSSAFPQHGSIADQIATRAEIKALEAKITDRMRDEALLDYDTVISEDSNHEFYNLTAKEAIAQIREQIAILRED